MTTNEIDYERIARWLDGQEVRLTDAERATAEGIRRDEARMGAALDVSPPASALARARRALPKRRSSRTIRILRWAAPLTAVAAAIVLAVVFSRGPVDPRPGAPGDEADVSVEVLASVAADSVTGGELGEELDSLEAELAAMDASWDADVAELTESLSGIPDEVQ